MGRPILAILAFNIYALCLIGAFQVNTVYLFDTDLIEQLKGTGFDVSPSQWGWGDHHIWRLFSGVVVTALVGVLAGAIAKERGAKISALANIPSVLVWAGMIYLYAYSENVELDVRIAFVAVSVIAIPATTYIAYFSGEAGEEIQRDFPEDTVLGIKGYHWGWIIFPLYLYALGIVYVVTQVILLAAATLWIDMSVVTSMLSLLMLVPIVVWVYPLLIAYRVLKGNLSGNHNAVVRGMANFCILTLGLPVAAAVQFGVYWLLSKMLA